MFEEYPEILSFKEVCKILQVSRPTLTQYLKSGQLKGFKIGKKRVWKIYKRDLEKFIKENY